VRDLARPQTEPGQHHEDGVVPSPQRCRLIATIKDCLNLRGGWNARSSSRPNICELVVYCDPRFKTLESLSSFRTEYCELTDGEKVHATIRSEAFGDPVP
jgi:hypothetical protein